MNQKTHNADGDKFVVALTVQFTQRQLDWIENNMTDDSIKIGDVVRAAVDVQMQRDFEHSADAMRVASLKLIGQ